jgi:hypothetical protein
MTKFHTVAITALLCSLLWIGGTAKIIDEYIKVVQIKEFQIDALESELKSNANIILMYDRATKELIYKCASKIEIRIGRTTYICNKIEKA